MQLALRDKEDLLVEKALERIRRAQMLGKTNVKLTQPEIDALERKRKKEEAKRKSSISNSRGTDRRRSSGQSSPVSRDHKPSRKKSKGYLSAYDGESSSSSRRATPPGILVPGPTGVPVYSPLGYYPPTTASKGRSSGSASRSASSHSLAQVSPPLPRVQKIRYSSGPEPPQPLPPLSRRLPDDLNWIPRPRSSSSVSSQPHPPDPYQYRAYSPPLPQIPPQYSQGRRIVSSPQPDVQYPRVRGEPHARSSDPSLIRMEHAGQRTPSDSEDATGSDDDDADEGVQVDVVAYGQSYGVNTRPGGSFRERPRRGQR